MTENFYSTNRMLRFSGKLKLFALTLLSVVSYGDVNAQLNYNFVTSSTTFTSIVGTPSSSTWGPSGSQVQQDDGIVGGIQIGFPFTIAGGTYTTLAMSSNGFLSFGTTQANMNGNSLSSPSSTNTWPIIAPLWEDLSGASGTATTVTTGSQPNRVFTAEWLNWKWNYSGPVAISFQVKLYETTNIIQFIYRQESGTLTTGSSGASIGLSNGNSTYISVQNTTSTPTVSTTAEANTILTKPATGQVYEFDPCNVATITTQPNPSVTVCAGNPANFSVVATNGVSYQWQVYNGSTYSFISPSDPAYSGATTSTLTINNPTTAMSGYVYKVFAFGTCAAGTGSNPAILTVNPTPTVTTQPLGTTVCDGVNTNFSIAASNTTGYQWQVSTDGGTTYSNTTDGTQYSGSTTSSLTVIAPGFAMNNYRYRAMVTGNCTPAGFSNPAIMQIKAKPAVTLDPVNAVACPGGSAQLTVGGTGVTLTYQWQVNTGNGTFTNISNGGVYGGATSTILTLNGVPTAMNGYSYRAVISGACAPSAFSAPATITISQLQAPLITPLSATTFCPGGNVTLNAPYDPNLTYQWLYYSNPIGTNGNSNTYTTGTPGAYTLQVTNTYGCTATSSATNVQLLPAPVVSASAAGDTVFCQGNSVTLHGSTHSGYAYFWKLNGNYISGANSSTYSANTSGSYAIEESDGTCLTTSSSIQVTVNPLPSVNITTDGSSSFCPGGSLDLHASTDFGTSYKWYENGGLMNFTTGTITALDPATYYVTVTDDNNCSATSSSITLTQSPTPVASIAVSGGAQPIICYNASLPLQANTGANLTYQWLYNGLPVNNATDPVFAATNGGTYDVEVMNEYGCKTTSNSIMLSTDIQLNPQIVATGNLLCTSPFASYKWYRNNLLISGATSACYTATQDGTYSVQVSDVVGCSARSEGIALTSVGVANIANQDDIRIYPNPANALIHIEAPITVNITITSLDGRVVMQQDKAKDVNISSLAAGMYMVSVYNLDNTLVKMEKIVKAD